MVYIRQMRRTILTTLLITCLFSLGNALAAKPLPARTKTGKHVKVKDLDAKYKDWLDLVSYIITPLEKDVFFELTNNKDRDAFIHLFWNLRDPSKGTPQNEFQEEHLKRFDYANHYFRGSPLPGWKSDRGRMYILLGPPVNIEEVNQNGLYPVLIWEYYGGPEKGLPTVFRIVFYKRYGSGDYKLYIPAVDGPYSLLQKQVGEVDPNDYYKVYDEILNISPSVANICLSLIPGEAIHEYNPSMQDPILIGNIYELPRRKINATYARNFLNYKGLVETSVLTNYFNVKSDLYILKDPIVGLNFVHFALLPDRISVDYSEDKDKYYFNFNLLVVLKKGEDVVFQYDHDFPFYYSKEDLDRQLSYGIIIMDYFPVIEGNFRLIAVLQNALNKEISYYESKVSSLSSSTPTPQVYGPLLSYQASLPSRQVFSPFNIMGHAIKVDPQKTFGLKDQIYSTFCIDRGNYEKKAAVKLDVECQDEARPYHKTYSFAMTEGKKFEIFSQTLETLNYGNYLIKASLRGEDDSVLASQERGFVVSPLAAVPHPPSAAIPIKSENHFVFYTMVAQQYENVQDFKKAEFYYEKAFTLNQSYPQLLKFYALFLLKEEKYAKALTVIQGLKSQEKELFDYYALQGRILYQKGSYPEAVDSLLEANKIYDSDILVLNTLGLGLLRIGQKEEAVKALTASLSINANQQDIAGLLQQLKGEHKNEKNKK
jgi:GWxTD domain-containing protein